MLQKLKASRTKYGIVYLIDIVKSGHLDHYLQGTYTFPKSINQAQLKGVLGIENSTSPLPSFWSEIENYPDLVGYFCAVAIIFSHHDYIKVFKKSSTGNMKGVIHKEDFDQKTFTNIRGILIKSGASSEEYLLAKEVPYNFSELYANGEVGLLIKKLLLNRLNLIGWAESPIPNSEFTRNFFEQCIWYEFHKVFSLNEAQFKSWLEGEPQYLLTEEIVNIDLKSMVKVDTHILASLTAKQFMIITGPSGTGKTYGIRQLASSLNPLYSKDKHFNLVFIPVEAGWKDDRHLVGYKNPFSDQGEVYQTTQLINLLLKANSVQYRKTPFFVIFDEMNLSHVEMYFARFLSLIETARHRDLPEEPLLNVEELELLKKSYKYNYAYISIINEAINNGGLFISKNVFFIGTVNIDETTYMFSPKVLDRAFVIEKNTELPSSIFGVSELEERYNATLSLGKVYDFLLGEIPTAISEQLIQFLDKVYNLLKDDFPFGYRVISECNNYYIITKNLRNELKEESLWLGVEEDNHIFDEILIQKILPKVHGNRKQLTTVLNNLIEFCQENDSIIYPKSYKKLKAMQKNLQITGYCGFVV